MKLFAKGSRVKQSGYGSGTVTSSDERYTIIEFDNHGRRTFVTDMVTLDKSDEPAPNRPEKTRRRKAAEPKSPTDKAAATKSPATKSAVKSSAAKSSAS